MSDGNVVQFRETGGSPKEYLEALTSMLNDINDLLKANDRESIEKTANYIKESARGHGFDDLSNFASQLETGLKFGDTGIMLKAIQYMREFANREVLKHR